MRLNDTQLTNRPNPNFQNKISKIFKKFPKKSPSPLENRKDT